MPTLAGYDNTHQQIMDALVDRVVGTEIQPEAHQQFALALLEYIRSVELISASTLIGQCTPATIPVQPDDANVAYVGAAPQAATTIWTNFHGYDGQPLTTITTSTSVALCVFTWNKQYWTVTTMTMDLTDILRETNERIDKIESDLKQEIFERKAADNTLDDKITVEANARANADNTLDNKIIEEANIRSNSDNTLQNNIDNEETKRQNADNTLDGKISAEAITRENVDANLQEQIDADVPTTKVFDTDLNQYQNELNKNGIIVCASVVNTANVNFITEKVYHLERNALGLYIGAVMRVGSTISRVPAVSGKLFSYNNTLYEYHNGYLIEISGYNFDRVFDGGRADTVFGSASRNINSGGAAD